MGASLFNIDNYSSFPKYALLKRGTSIAIPTSIYVLLIIYSCTDLAGDVIQLIAFMPNMLISNTLIKQSHLMGIYLKNFKW